MQLSFICAAVLGLGYLVCIRRRFDLFSVAFLCALVYFLPGFWGEVKYPALGPLFDITTPILDEAYAVMIFVLGMIVLGARICTRQVPIDLQIRDTHFAGELAALIGVAGCVACFVTVGPDVLLSDDKHLILDKLNRWYITWETGAILGATLCFARRRWLGFSVSALLLAATLFVGFRVGVAITAIAIFTLILQDRDWLTTVRKSWRLGVMAVVVAVFLFAYKGIFIAVKVGDFAFIAETASSARFWTYIFTSSEPFYTQAILNEVIARNFRVEIDHVAGALATAIPFLNEAGMEAMSFDDLFQARLFPLTRNFGLANNIWAQMIASGGWPLLILFAGFFVSLIAAGNALLRGSGPDVKSLVAVLGSYWVFYIHRNDLLYQLLLERRVLFLFIVAAVGSKLLAFTMRNLPPSAQATYLEQ